jgi:hypothetical protein
MNPTRRTLSLLFILALAATLMGCGSRATPAPLPEATTGFAGVKSPMGLPAEAPLAADALALERTAGEEMTFALRSPALQGAAIPSAQATPAPFVQTGPAPLADPNRLIIKNANFDIVVADAAVALDRLAALAAGSGGYLISNQVHDDGGYKVATVQFAVPADQFEAALQQVRKLAVRVNSESASGQDVSEEFVDLQARIKNQEATADRIRGFLDQAKNADEALKINQQLTQVEQEIEQLKGRANWLQQRAAFSIITVFVQPERPTPSPTPTLTPTPTPTPIPPWQPGPTMRQASGRLQVVAQALADALIWLAVFWLPILLPIVVVALLVVWLVRRRSHTSPPPTPGAKGE